MSKIVIIMNAQMLYEVMTLDTMSFLRQWNYVLTLS